MGAFVVVEVLLVRLAGPALNKVERIVGSFQWRLEAAENNQRTQAGGKPANQRNFCYTAIFEGWTTFLGVVSGGGKAG